MYESRSSPHFSKKSPQGFVQSLESRAGSLTSRLLYRLSGDSLFQKMAEYWTRADAATWLLRDLCARSFSNRVILVQSSCIYRIVDLFLGESSPAANSYYVKGSRKTCPSSSIPLHSFEKASANNYIGVPDWLCLLESLSLLIRTARTDAMRIATPSTLLAPDHEDVRMDEMSFRCASYMPLFSTMLTQERYAAYLGDIISHLCYESLNLTNDVCDMLQIVLSEALHHTTARLFIVLQSFLNIQDSLTSHRAMLLFSNQSSGLLEAIQRRGVKDPKFACVCIRSLMELIQKCPSVKNVLSSSTNIYNWAPPMLKFCYQYLEKQRAQVSIAAAVGSVSVESDCSGNIGKGLVTDAGLCQSATLPAEDNILSSPFSGDVGANNVSTIAYPAQQLQTGLTSKNLPPPQRGEYLVVYGESEEDRYCTWVDRAENAFALLREALMSMGASPEALIPADAFVLDSDGFLGDGGITTSVDRGVGGSGTFGVQGHLSGTVLGHGYTEGDAMTDEQYAAFLQAEINTSGLQ